MRSKIGSGSSLYDYDTTGELFGADVASHEATRIEVKRAISMIVEEAYMHDPRQWVDILGEVYAEWKAKGFDV